LNEKDLLNPKRKKGRQKHTPSLTQGEGDNMPKVGKKHYPYTTKGRAAAKMAAKKKGVKVGYGKRKK
jgi:hypothetical protein